MKRLLQWSRWFGGKILTSLACHTPRPWWNKTHLVLASFGSLDNSLPWKLLEGRNLSGPFIQICFFTDGETEVQGDWTFLAAAGWDFSSGTSEPIITFHKKIKLKCLLLITRVMSLDRGGIHKACSQICFQNGNVHFRTKCRLFESMYVFTTFKIRSLRALLKVTEDLGCPWRLVKRIFSVQLAWILL